MSISAFMVALARSSLAASLLIFLVLAIQYVFRKQLAPRWATALWFLVILRLLPFSFTSEWSVFNLLPRWMAGKSHGATNAHAGAPQPANVTQPAGVIALADEAVANTATGSEKSTGGNFAAKVAPGIAGNPDWSTIVFGVWLSGVLLVGGYVVIGARSLAKRLSRSPELNDPATLRMLQECCQRLEISRPPLVFETGEVATPGLQGLWRPRLLLPRGFSKAFSEDELRFVLLHELAHLKRRDLALNWAVTALQILHWFNPVVWLGLARWRMDREIACDAVAIEAAGAGQNLAYGRTMLRLLESFSFQPPQPGWVGILESKRDLRRRMEMIARYRPARRPLVAIALMVALGVVGLTDAQVERPVTMLSPVAAPMPLMGLRLDGQFVVFLVQTSGSMLGETIEEAVERRGHSDDRKRSAPKWQRVVHALHGMTASLGPDSHFQIFFYNEDTTSVLPARGNEWFSVKDKPTINEIVTKINNVVPKGGANLEHAFKQVRFLPRLPDRIVLVTDGLPTKSVSLPLDGDVGEEQRIRFFEIAVKQLPPRIPVSTLLFPLLSGDPGAPGMYWELANATRGALVSPPKSWPASTADLTHLAFVIDCSGSMRDPVGGGLWPIAVRKIEEVLDAHPNLAGIQVLDADGRFIMGRSAGQGQWLSDTAEVRTDINRTLRRYETDNYSNPVPGIYNVMRQLYDAKNPAMKLGIYIFGDEFNSGDSAEAVIKKLGELNPADRNGDRNVEINAMGFPTMIRTQFSMGNTGVRFANLMRAVTHEHGGMFVAVPDL